MIFLLDIGKVVDAYIVMDICRGMQFFLIL